MVQIDMDSSLSTPINSSFTDYDRRYLKPGLYWGEKPSSMAYRVLELAPPVRPLKLLDVGCGEGKDALFFARNGYDVTAFDLSENGIQKARDRATELGLEARFFTADVNACRLEEDYDIIFSSGTLQYLHPELRAGVIENFKAHTRTDGLNVLHTFVSKPFIAKAPDAEEHEALWRSGELLAAYHDWLVEWSIEEVRPCQSSGVAHRHAHNRVIARRPGPDSLTAKGMK